MQQGTGKSKGKSGRDRVQATGEVPLGAGVDGGAAALPDGAADAISAPTANAPEAPAFTLRKGGECV